MDELFEWDDAKAQANQEKHNVSFEEASTVFEDVGAITKSDPFHSEEEDRQLLIGFSTRGRLLIVSYTYRNDTIRILSAREAARNEATR